MRKKRVGETKGSNAWAGCWKRLVRRSNSVRDVHGFERSTNEVLSTRWVDGGVEDGDWMGGWGGSGEVTMCVQSKIPSFTMSPAMLKGVDLEDLLSVSAREVASVPPRCEP